MTTRRDFLKHSSFLAAAAATTGFPRFAFGHSPRPGAGGRIQAVDKAKKPLHLLILGGTGFLGPCVVRHAVARGHTMTLFNRGKTDPNAFPELEKLKGDRNTADLKALEGRDWDAVIDTSGYFPKQVRESAGLLAAHVSQYVFISTISVYKPLSTPNADETAPLEKLPENVDPDTLKTIGRNYGALKALCEEAAEKEMPGQVANIRPGLIVGPDDDSDRYTYWPVRVAQGGEVLAPGLPDDPVQFIDVRDLAAFTIRCIENATVGIFNGTGPQGGMPISKMLGACKEAAKSNATFTYVDDAFLDEQKIGAWSDLPVWVSPRQEGGGLTTVNVERALKAGLELRSPVDTARDTLQWYRDTKRHANFSFTKEREEKALAAWHEKHPKDAAGGGAKRP